MTRTKQGHERRQRGDDRADDAPPETALDVVATDEADERSTRISGPGVVSARARPSSMSPVLSQPKRVTVLRHIGEYRVRAAERYHRHLLKNNRPAPNMPPASMSSPMGTASSQPADERRHDCAGAAALHRRRSVTGVQEPRRPTAGRKPPSRDGEDRGGRSPRKAAKARAASTKPARERALGDAQQRFQYHRDHRCLQAEENATHRCEVAQRGVEHADDGERQESGQKGTTHPLRRRRVRRA